MNVSGQAFVVTEGRENVKLGLVTVGVLREQDVVEHIGKLQATVDSARHAMEARNAEELRAEEALFAEVRQRADSLHAEVSGSLIRAESELQTAIAVAKRARDEATEADRRYAEAHARGVTENPSTAPGYEPALEELRTRDQAATAAEAAKSKCAPLEAEVARLRRQSMVGADYPSPQPGELPVLRSADVFKDLPQAIRTVETDADGRFNVQVPKKGRYVLAAHASRQTLSGAEEYFWLVRLNDRAERQMQVLLSNNDMTSSGSPKSMFKEPEGSTEH